MLQHNLNDLELIQKYREGDMDALQILIERYLNQIYSFVLGYTHDPNAAEDVAQEVFIKVWTHLAKFDSEKSFKVWLYTIAKHTALDYLKKRKLIAFSALGDDEERVFEVEDKSLSPHQLLSQKDLGNTLQVILEELPIRYREVLLLYYHNDFNFREIADILKESINTVKSRYRRALKMLRESLKNVELKT